MVLVAGLILGFCASTLAYRFHYMHPPGEDFVHRLDHALNLTPAQHDQVVQMIEDTRLKMAEMRHDWQRQRHELMVQTSQRIRTVLTPEQQQEFDRSFKLGELGPPPEEHPHP